MIENCDASDKVTANDPKERLLDGKLLLTENYGNSTRCIITMLDSSRRAETPKEEEYPNIVSPENPEFEEEKHPCWFE